MMSLWDALRMNMMISYQELVRTFHNKDATKDKLDNIDATNDKLDNRGTIKDKLNNIYGKSIDYSALRHRDIIIAKIDLFIQRITHNLWHARKKMCF
ncbi:yjbL [Escherichia coli]|nr:yjbL [Escherichia coli]